MIKNLLQPGTNVYLLYTASMDSKGAAYLLKYFLEQAKINVSVEFAKYNGAVPRNLPNPEYATNTHVVCCGVTLSADADKYIRKHYETTVYENDGKRSICKEIFDQIKKHPNFIHVNVDQPNISKWVSFIADFHVRNELWDEGNDRIKHLIYFNLTASCYNTWINSNGRNYFWDRLMEIPGEFLQVLLSEGTEIYNYKKKRDNSLYRHIKTIEPEVLGNRCRIANKRDADSGFFQCKDLDVDFLIAYEASSDLDQRRAFEKLRFHLSEYPTSKEILAAISSFISLTFTVYRNREDADVLDFIKPFKGSGHSKVGSFTVSDKNLIEEFVTIEALLKIKPTLCETDTSDVVQKYRNSIQTMYKKRGLFLNGALHVINNVCDFDSYSDSVGDDLILYRFNNDSIIGLLKHLQSC